MSVPVASLSRRYRFAASHRLNAASMSSERNAVVFGKCNNPHGHGHNYVATITVSGAVDVSTGMVTNLADLDAFAQENLLARFDHTNLNTLPAFTNAVPSTENLTLEFWRIFSAYPHATLTRVLVEETGNNSFEYAGEERGSFQ